MAWNHSKVELIGTLNHRETPRETLVPPCPTDRYWHIVGFYPTTKPSKEVLFAQLDKPNAVFIETEVMAVQLVMALQQQKRGLFSLLTLYCTNCHGNCGLTFTNSHVVGEERKLAT